MIEIVLIYKISAFRNSKITIYLALGKSMRIKFLLAVYTGENDFVRRFIQHNSIIARRPLRAFARQVQIHANYQAIEYN